jgi:site-specific DNA-methyltransferase (adenine-specific)
MLEDDRLRVIEDFPDSNDVFPGTKIKGGVLFFLWDRENRGLCRVRTHDKGEVGEAVERPLLELGADIFIRYNEALPILKKIIAAETNGAPDSPSFAITLPEDKRFARLVSSRKPFGFDTTFQGHTPREAGDLLLYRNGGVSYVSRSEVATGADAIDRWKVFIPPLGSGSDSFPHPILGRPFVGEPGSVSSETYLYIGPFDREDQAESVKSYIATKFFRFLILLHKPSQHATRTVYTFVPTQDFSKPWTDEMLYEKYGITDDEAAFIDKMIRPMDLGEANGGD